MYVCRASQMFPKVKQKKKTLSVKISFNNFIWLRPFGQFTPSNTISQTHKMKLNTVPYEISLNIFEKKLIWKKKKLISNGIVFTQSFIYF